MGTFKWGDEFVTGLTEVDNQHQKLVSMINELGDIVADNSSTRDGLLSMARKLTEYAHEHFDTEKRIMAQLQLDERHTEPHQRQHADFLKNVSSIAASIDEDIADNSQMLHQYLINWLAFHILGTDQNMARQIATIEAGSRPAEAYENYEKDENRQTEPLVRALNELFTIVSKRNRELLSLNKALESRVAERTKELVLANEALEKLAITDHLTELPNRRFVMGQLQLLFEASRLDAHPLSCLMIDVDDFKEINDRYGHDAGDVALRKLAQKIHHSVRSDDILCRLGGDEFIVVCPDTALEGALYAAEQIRKEVSSLKIPVGQGFETVSISIGAACTSQGIDDASMLLKAADEALMEAKRSGRNCVKSGEALA
jgi:diguanylate cyclase (GGDEF)-like protein/hemerythrin-like metal-binding protein